MKVHALADLKTLQRAMAARAAREAAEREGARQAQLQREREHRLFELAVGPVQPIACKGRIAPHRLAVAPLLSVAMISML